MYKVYLKVRFSRVVKRHGFGGVGQATHGQHNRLRAPGSVELLLIHLEYSKECVWLEEWEEKM
jgi:hypothetical protein